jgi:hypothetical protein
MPATVMNTSLCDEAFTITLIDAYFAEQIGADGPELPFRCRWMNKITKNSKKVPFKIAGVGSESSGEWCANHSKHRFATTNG